MAARRVGCSFAYLLDAAFVTVTTETGETYGADRLDELDAALTSGAA